MAYKYVPVSKEDTYALIAKAQEGDEEAKTLICQQNTGLVKKIALKFSSSEYETEDLIQIGYMGLLKAVYKFRPEFDVMFSTYAVPMIMGELKRFFRDTGKIKASRSLKSEIYALKKAQEKLMAEEGGQPKLSRLAQVMGVSKDRCWRSWRRRLLWEMWRVWTIRLLKRNIMHIIVRGRLKIIWTAL